MNTVHFPGAPRLFEFDNTYARDLVGFYAECSPQAVPQPRLVALNRPLAAELGLDPEALASPEGVAILAGNVVPAGASPLAQAYAGHQFGHFSPRLGDGRALLLGEIVDRSGRRRDIAFKGSGPTPFARRGDGKCALGPALREYLVGEAMAVLGIPTTRTLAVVASGETLRRDGPVPGAVLTRVAASHLRIGTFEFFAAHRGSQAVSQLVSYALQRHDPDDAGGERAALALLESVARRQADLVARWLGVGFIHGVMNTDNMTVSGETIDYGPCAFLERYDPATAFSSIDTEGRYAYGQQEAIARWNLTRFAEALLPLIDPDTDRAIAEANRVLEGFPVLHAECWLAVMRKKLGLDGRGDAEGDRNLALDFLDLLRRAEADFTLAFRALTHAATGFPEGLQRIFADGGAADWQARWRARQGSRDAALIDAMKRANPCYIPRNHRVEEALDAAVRRGDFAPFERLHGVLARPCDERPEDAAYAEPADAAVTAAYRTFCGT